MTVELSSGLLTAIQSYHVRTAFLVSIGLNTGGPLNSTDANRKITYGGVDYLPDTGLLSISRPQHEVVASRDNFSVEFADNTGDIRGRFVTDHIRGLTVNAKIAFLNEDGEIIDALDMYTGISAAMVWQEEGDGYKCAVSFTGQLHQLEASYPLSTTPASQSRFNPTDTSMENAHESTNDDELRWGKES